MNVRRFLSAVVALALLSCTGTAAEMSDPVGAFRLRLRGSSDTIVSLPLQRTPLIEAAIASRSANALTLASDVPALPAEGAFALVMTGTLEGAVLRVSAIAGRTVTVDASGFDLAAFKTVASAGSTLADSVCLVPYWTLDTLFPQGRGVQASTSATLRATEVLIYDDTLVGTQLAPSLTFFYFAGNATKAAGWYKVGDTATAKGTQTLSPHRYFLVRNNNAADTELTVMGAVQMAGFRVPILLRAADTDQDNLVALPIATPLSLDASRLYQSGAFAASTSATLRTDELLVYDNTVVGKQKAPSATFFYFAGNASKAAGWYKVGDTAQTSNGFLLKPGEGYIVRKKRAASPRSDLWSGLPGYLQ